MKKVYIYPQTKVVDSTFCLSMFCGSNDPDTPTPTPPSKGKFEVGYGRTYGIDGDITTEENGEAGTKYRGFYNSDW